MDDANLADRLDDVGNIFEQLSREFPEGQVRIGISTVKQKGHAISTCLCFAGWYGKALQNQIYSECLEPWTYIPAAEYMARFLGFDSSFEFIDWAKENPHLWGNKFGLRIFGNSQAFGVSHPSDLTLPVIAAHLKGVTGRVRAQMEATP